MTLPKLAVASIFYAAIILAGTAQSLIFNTWDLFHLRLPKYYINPTLLSGVLLLYDRPMFFETRKIEIREKGQTEFRALEFDLRRGPFETYVQRRLFRFATNELGCGCDSKAAFEILYCDSTLITLKDLDVQDVRLRFFPLIWDAPERVFEHRCDDAR